MVVRNHVAKDVAQQLYEDLLRVALPKKEDDDVHPSLVETFGDAGSNMDNAPLAHEAIDSVHNSSLKQSAVFRLEHLKESSYDISKELIHQVAPNNIMEEGGTIHLYVSSPGAAALANHTDTTDIFVLHLGGAKEWLLCKQHKEYALDTSNLMMSDKLDTCSTYNQNEIDTLKCTVETLYPGDAMFLPMRVVHSAGAVSDAPSAHLTFAFANSDEAISRDFCTESYAGIPEQRGLKGRRRLCDKDDHEDDDEINPYNCDHGCNRSCCTGNDCKRTLLALPVTVPVTRELVRGCNKGCDDRCNRGCNPPDDD